MDPEAEKKHLEKLANTKMPFGKYAGRKIIDLPEPYLVWFSGKGFPSGEIGLLLQEVFELKQNGLEKLVRPFGKRGV